MMKGAQISFPKLLVGEVGKLIHAENNRTILGIEVVNEFNIVFPNLVATWKGKKAGVSQTW